MRWLRNAAPVFLYLLSLILTVWIQFQTFVSFVASHFSPLWCLQWSGVTAWNQLPSLCSLHMLSATNTRSFTNSAKRFLSWTGPRQGIQLLADTWRGVISDPQKGKRLNPNLAAKVILPSAPKMSKTQAKQRQWYFRVQLGRSGLRVKS